MTRRGNDPADMTPNLWRTLLHLAGEKQAPKARRMPMHAATLNALERRRLIEWEYTKQHAGWQLTDKGRFYVAWWKAQPEGGGQP